MNRSVEQETIRSLFRERKELIGLVYEFNFLPAGYIHESWISPPIPPLLFKKIIQSKRGIEKLSQWIVTQYNLKQDHYCDFIDPLFRLALIPSEMIRKISLYCGIALNYKLITAVINKREKEKIIQKIGQEGYQFGIKAAPLLIGNQKSYPKKLLSRENLTTFLESCGASYFLESFGKAPKALYKRLTFKFPKNIGQNQDLLPKSMEADDHWLFLKRILKHAIEPKWHHLFS